MGEEISESGHLLTIEIKMHVKNTVFCDLESKHHIFSMNFRIKDIFAKISPVFLIFYGNT